MRVPHQIVEPNGWNGKVNNSAGSYLRMHDDLGGGVCSVTPWACNGVIDATRAGLNNGTKVAVALAAEQRACWAFWLLINGEVNSSAG